MKTALLTCAALITLLGVWTDSAGLLGVIALLALAWSAVLLRDLQQLCACAHVNQSCTKLATAEARLVASTLAGARFRIQNVEWQLNTNAALEVESQPLGEIDRVRVPHDLQEFPPILRGLLDLSARVFRARAQAIVKLAQPLSSESEALILSRGIAGARFHKQIALFAREGFAGRSAAFGVIDGHQAASLLGEFSAWGHRYVMAVPLEWRSADEVSAEQHRAVLWLGYGEDREPLPAELERARSLARVAIERLEGAQHAEKLAARLAEAEQANRTKSSFITQMSHDIRSPLNNVKSILSILSLELGQGEQYELARTAISNCDALSEIVEDVLDFTKHTAGRLSAERLPTSAGEVLAAVLAGFGVAARLRGLELRHVLDKRAGLIAVDRRQLRRILTNLLSNALKYTVQGGVTVALCGSEHEVEIRVKDTGLGLNPEQLKLLFTPFTRFHMTNDQGGAIEGVGLGLTVSRILTELNGGAISVVSELGVGSTFTLRFPVAQQGHVCDRSIVDQNQALVDCSGYRILVVDDDAQCAASLARVLVAQGCEASFATSVREAEGVLNFDPPDVLISDEHMPEGGCRRLIEFVRRRKLTVSVGIVRGDIDAQERAKLLMFGADAVFEKPVAIDALLEWLKLQVLKGAKKSDLREPVFSGGI